MINLARKTIETLEKLTGLPFKRLIKFSLVGGSGIIVNMGIFFILNEFFGLIYKISSIISIELAIINNYTWNSLWTWKDRATDSSKEKKTRFFKYHLITGFAALINYIILRISVDFLDINKYIANLVGIFLGMGFNFILNHKWTFKKKKIG